MGIRSRLRHENPSYLRQRKQSFNLTGEALFFCLKMSGGAFDEAKGFSYIFNRAGTHSGHRCFDSTQKQPYSTRQIYRRSRRYTYKSYAGSKETPCCALHLNKIGQAACFSYLRSRRLFCVLIFEKISKQSPQKVSLSGNK